MQSIVLDSSIIVKWLNQHNELHIEHADQILEDAKNGKVELFAPELAKYELGNVLLKGKQLTPDEAYISMSTTYSLPITFVNETHELAKETYSYAYKLNITYYDAAFLALTKQFNAILITENKKHQGKTKDVNVESLQEYQSP